MNKYVSTLILIFLIFPASANLIHDGEFINGLGSWGTDSATFGSPGYSTDFSVTSTGARLRIDYDDTNEFVANTLFQTIDLTGFEADVFTLSFDWIFDGEEAGISQFENGGEYWTAIISDGVNIVSLFEGNDYGNDSFNTSLDFSSVFTNPINITLEFQLLAGFDFNFMGSTLDINKVSLSRNTANPPIAANSPGVALLMVSFLVTCLVYSNKKRRFI